MQMPAGWLVDRFDVKWVFAAGFFVWSAATAVTGVLHGFVALLMIRVILGIGESVAFPSYSKIFADHVSGGAPRLRQRADHRGLGARPGDWHARRRKRRRPLRLAAILSGSGPGRIAVAGSVVRWMPRSDQAVSRCRPLRGRECFPILRQRSAWGTCLGQFCVNYYLYFLVTWLPFYLVRGRHLSMNDDGAETAACSF